MMEADGIKTLFKFVRDGFVLVDKDRRVVSVNPALREILGWDPTSLVNPALREVLGWDPSSLMSCITCDELFQCQDVKGCPLGRDGCPTVRSNGSDHQGIFHETTPPTLSGGRRTLWLSCSPLPQTSWESPSGIILIRDITGRKRAEKELRQLSLRDELTGLYNHRFFITQLIEEIYRSRRYSRALSLLMIDIDDFKRYNDTHGHYEGDKLLVKISRVFLMKIRATDIVARYGGEEFAIILPETSRSGAYDVAEKLRKAVKEVLPNGPSISTGVAAFPDHAEDLETLINQADQALYEAKYKGKDRVCIFSA